MNQVKALLVALATDFKPLGHTVERPKFFSYDPGRIALAKYEMPWVLFLHGWGTKLEHARGDYYRQNQLCQVSLWKHTKLDNSAAVDAAFDESYAYALELVKMIDLLHEAGDEHCEVLRHWDLGEASVSRDKIWLDGYVGSLMELPLYRALDPTLNAALWQSLS